MCRAGAGPGDRLVPPVASDGSMSRSGKHLAWRRAERLALLGVAAGLAVFAVALPSAGAAGAGQLKCPLKASSEVPPGEVWAFHETGAPSTPHPGIASFYTHGRGGWGGGHGSGTICEEDSLSTGPSHTIVLTVAGPSRVSPLVTRLGHPGVELGLSVSVSASDDPACPTHTRGAVTIFASYYEGHYDKVQLHFNGSCAAYSATFLGPHVSALIADNGRQVNES